jgi:hypothetical protein
MKVSGTSMLKSWRRSWPQFGVNEFILKRHAVKRGRKEERRGEDRKRREEEY